MSISGHLWTIHGFLKRWLQPPPAPPSRSWRTVVQDPRMGPVRLTGELSVPAGAQAAVVVVHGLGGCAESPYVVEAAASLFESRLACLRLNLRGADRAGEDIYHGGLTADLEASLHSDELRSYERVGLLGFSLGGHLTLRFAADSGAARISALAAVCPPLDLAAAATAIDTPSRWPYRRYLLDQLCEIYAAVARRRRFGISLETVRRARRFVSFDNLVIAPRHGFRDAWDYYRSVSVGPDLVRLRTRSLMVVSRDDPMIPAASLERFLDESPDCLEIHWLERGGHLGFPSRVDLGYETKRGLTAQVVKWLSRRLLPSS